MVSDSQLADLKKRQAQEELASLRNQRLELDRAYEQRKEVLEGRIDEVRKQIDALAPAEEKAEVEA